VIAPWAGRAAWAGASCSVELSRGKWGEGSSDLPLLQVQPCGRSSGGWLDGEVWSSVSLWELWGIVNLKLLNFQTISRSAIRGSGIRGLGQGVMAGDRRFRQARARPQRPGAGAARLSWAPSRREVPGVPVHGVPGESCPLPSEPMSSAESEGSRGVPGRRCRGGGGRAHQLKYLMQPDTLAAPRYQADPPPSCLLEAMAGRPQGRVKCGAYWSRVLRELPGTEFQKADACAEVAERVPRWVDKAKVEVHEGAASPHSSG